MAMPSMERENMPMGRSETVDGTQSSFGEDIISNMWDFIPFGLFSESEDRPQCHTPSLFLEPDTRNLPFRLHSTPLPAQAPGLRVAPNPIQPNVTSKCPTHLPPKSQNTSPEKLPPFELITHEVPCNEELSHHIEFSPDMVFYQLLHKAVDKRKPSVIRKTINVRYKCDPNILHVYIHTVTDTPRIGLNDILYNVQRWEGEQIAITNVPYKESLSSRLGDFNYLNIQHHADSRKTPNAWKESWARITGQAPPNPPPPMMVDSSLPWAYAARAEDRRINNNPLPATAHYAAGPSQYKWQSHSNNHDIKGSNLRSIRSPH